MIAYLNIFPIFLAIPWIHLPVNNMDWAERCISKCGRQTNESSWTMSVRPAFVDTIRTPLHSRHMELRCVLREQDDDVTQDPLCTVYMNEDRYKHISSLNKAYTHVHSVEPLENLKNTAPH
ncbi:hypothetical protein M3J07_012456 [Ascochyta lentis]